MLTTRRNLLRTVGIGLAYLPFINFSCIFPKNNPYLETIGLHLRTVRELIADDPRGTLAQIKNIGYRQVELMDVKQLPELLPIARDLDLAVHSSFFNWTTLTGRWDLRPEEDPSYTFDDVLAAAVDAGLTHLVFGYLLPQERSQLDDYLRIAERLNEAGEKCAAAGLKLSYYNHAFEFQPLEGKVPFEVLIENLDPKLVGFELDVFWASLGGCDPIALMKKLGDRINLLHLKDKKAGTPTIYNEAQAPPEVFVELGKGVVPIGETVALAAAIGIEYCMIGQDYSTNPMESIAESMRYLVEF